MKKEKQNLNESLSRIKNLFQHERGVVISEQSYLTLINEEAAKGDYSNPYIDSEMTGDVDTVQFYLDRGVWESELKTIKEKLDKYVNKWAKNEENPASPIIVPALTRFGELYAIDESGDSLYNDIASIGERTMGTEAINLKRQCLNILLNSNNQQAPAPEIVLKWGDGSEASKCFTQIKKDGHSVTLEKSDDGVEYFLIAYTDPSLKPGYFYRDGELAYEDVNKPGEFISKKWACSEQPDGNGRYNIQYI
jgi:hypothetical protein